MSEQRAPVVRVRAEVAGTGAITSSPLGQASGTLSRARSGLQVASWLALALTLAVALVLRVIGIDRLPGINGDEAGFGVHALSWLDGASLLSLRTGTDLPMNAPFFGVVVALHTWLGPSFFTLRLAALTHSLLALLLAWWLFRREGRNFVTFFVASLALLPIHIGYARFAWDPAAVPSVMVLALAAATRLQAAWTLSAFALALSVHPATVFALPVLAAPFVDYYWPRTDAGQLRLPSARACLSALAALVALVLSLFWLERHAGLPTPVLYALRGQLLSHALQRLISPNDAFEFACLYVDFLSGATLYRYITGSLPELAGVLHTVVGTLLLSAASWFGVRKLMAAGRTRELSIALGLVCSLGLAYVFGGLKVLRPSTERYGMFLTVPSCYVLATFLDAIAADARRAAQLRYVIAAVGAVLLSATGMYYFAPMWRVDPARERTFLTGDVEPKRQALSVLQSMRDPTQDAVVLAQDWWIYWPVRYLSHADRKLHITIPGRPWDERFPADFRAPTLDDPRVELYAIAWAGSPYAERLRRYALQATPVLGYQPGPILYVYRLPPPPSR